jgi:hypothetical protein
MCWKLKTPSIPAVSTAARDILPSTEAKEPEAPILGDEVDFVRSATKRGKDALKINLDSSVKRGGSSSYYG